jgi:hypothetical protein
MMIHPLSGPSFSVSSLDEALAAYVPARHSGKTRGLLVSKDNAYEVVSGNGKQGTAMHLDDALPGINQLYIYDHAEAHAAGGMRARGDMNGELYLNNSPCKGPYGCGRMLPHMLQEGADLRIHLRQESGKFIESGNYTGLPDIEWGDVFHLLTGGQR